jgi:N-methylhydantoinase B
MGQLAAVLDEMTLSLERAAMTPILSLCRDYSCCIYDASLRQVATADGLPIQTGSMDLVLRSIATFFEDDVAEGDVFLCNDPHRGNTHVGDLVAAAPVFVSARLRFWAVTRGHQLDVGAPVPSAVNPAAVDVWQEGLVIPPLKLIDAGTMRRDLLELYLSNVRWRDLLEGDLMAQLGSVLTGARRLRQLCEGAGGTAVEPLVREVLAYARRRTRDELSQFPRGTYRAEVRLDRLAPPLQCSVTISSDGFAIDFTEAPDQVRAGNNASEAVALAAGAVPILLSLDSDIPRNSGCLEFITVTARKGSICNARFPAATSAATTDPGDAMQEVVLKALAEAVPERVPAGSARWANIPMISGSASKGSQWGHLLLNGGGGGGCWSCRGRMAAYFDKRGSRGAEGRVCRAHGVTIPASI